MIKITILLAAEVLARKLASDVDWTPSKLSTVLCGGQEGHGGGFYRIPVIKAVRAASSLWKA
jgi:hypothetical protein